MGPLWLYRLYLRKGIQTALIRWSVLVSNLVGWVVILCVFPVPYLMFLSYRLGVSLWLRCRHRGEVKLMDASDAIFALPSADRPNSRAIVVSWIAVDGCVDILNFKERIRKRIQEDTWFQKLTFSFQFRLGYLVWKKDKCFSVDHHVKLIAEPEKASLEDLLEALQCRDFEVDRSPWEILVLMSGEKTTLIIRWHHCLADGPGMINGLSRLILDENPTSPIRKIPKRTATNLKTFFALLKSMFYLPTIMLWLSLIPEGNRLSVTHPTKRKRVFFSDPMPSEPLKRTAKKLACTINDIFISCVIQGYQMTLLRPTDTLSVAIPISLHRDSPQICNRVSPIRVPLPVAFDGEARIREIREMTRCLKASPDILCGYAVQHILSNVLPSWVSKSFRWAKVAGCVSNVASLLPSNARIQDHLVSSLCGFAPPLLDIGIAISLVSTGTSYHFAIMADQSAFKKSEDARIFLGTMVNHVDVLASAAGISREKSDSSTPSFSYIVPIIKYSMESEMMQKESLRGH
ncbi:unnamed protein product [Darwinula stevensoni]|uniref:Diacylglycerol O-acyltransferase n=1 Tax=Darwinula stevensoni TaxID=69355 RepID=A0A7R9A543_9CRUS|nr:unnamed protein product [Darwinula stevensoni]CAG0891309.1 unnamed protein product [Darwinula stevensoni]